LLVVASHRWDWYGEIYDTEDVLDAYGEPRLRAVVDGTHTDVVQRACTNRLPAITELMDRALRGRGREAQV
jgi:hypothetical protein